MSAPISHWRELSADPNDPRVRQYLREQLRAARRGHIRETETFLKEFVRDQSVLDIGVVAHTIAQADDPRWRHNLIRDAASSVVGVDILAEPVMQLRARGYDIRVVDATSAADLGQRFSRIVIGDVIEHVDNPVALLRFAMRHLAPHGCVLCSTPNPFHLGSVWSVLREGTFIANAEHVSWITPTMILELAQRAGLRLSGYWTAPKTRGTLLRKVSVKALAFTGIWDCELFSRTFVYLLERDEHPDGLG